TVRSALTEDGRFAFETRNPAAREWEGWTPASPIDFTHTSGAAVRFERDVELPVQGDLVSFTSTYTSPTWDRPRQSRSTLRFLDAASLASFLSGAGLAIEEQLGDWNGIPLTGPSPETIPIPRRGHRRSSPEGGDGPGPRRGHY